MTAQLTYQIIMTLPEKERELLLNMLEPQMKKFDLEELISDEVPPAKISNDEMMLLLIDRYFSKVKDS
jgi:hypothetical protein